MSERAAWLAAHPEWSGRHTARPEALAWAQSLPRPASGPGSRHRADVELRVVPEVIFLDERRPVLRAVSTDHQSWAAAYRIAHTGPGRRVVKIDDADDPHAVTGVVLDLIDEATALVDWGVCPGYPAGVCIEYRDELLPVSRPS